MKKPVAMKNGTAVSGLTGKALKRDRPEVHGYVVECLKRGIAKDTIAGIFGVSINTVIATQRRENIEVVNQREGRQRLLSKFERNAELAADLWHEGAKAGKVSPAQCAIASGIFSNKRRDLEQELAASPHTPPPSGDTGISDMLQELRSLSREVAEAKGRPVVAVQVNVDAPAQPKTVQTPKTPIPFPAIQN